MKTARKLAILGLCFSGLQNLSWSAEEKSPGWRSWVYLDSPLYRKPETLKTTDFNLAGAELEFFSPLGDAGSGSFMVAAHDDSGRLVFDIHHAEFKSEDVLGPIGFRVGKTPIGFGRINSIHSHDWSFPGGPEFQEVFFGSGDTLMDLGLGFFSGPNLSDNFKFNLGLFEGSCWGHCHGGGDLPRRPTVSGRLGYQIGESGGNSEFELGLSGLNSYDATGLMRTLGGMDFAFGKISDDLELGDFVVEADIIYGALKNSGSTSSDKILGGYLYPRVGLTPTQAFGLRFDGRDSGSDESLGLMPVWSWAPIGGLGVDLYFKHQVNMTVLAAADAAVSTRSRITNNELGVELTLDFGSADHKH